jgi:hypothetical protein
MKQIDILREIFDEKIVSVISIFLENPDTQFSLTQISSMSKVNIATTLRIIDKLLSKDMLELVVVGKSKFYKLKKNEKALTLNKFLRSEEEPILEFAEILKTQTRVEKIVLESKSKSAAKLLVVGNYLQTERINEAAEQIKKRFHYHINFLEISTKQFKDMQRMGFYDIEKKILWQRAT